MFFLHAVWIPALLVGLCGASPSNNPIISELRVRQDSNSSGGLNIPPMCQDKYHNLSVIAHNCNSTLCACTQNFIGAQSSYLLCAATNPQDAAAVQFLVDGETAKCRRDGIPISVRVPLSAAAEAVVQHVYHENAVLRTNQTAYLVLQIVGGHVGLVVLLICSVLLPTHRDPTFLNFCITWIFSSIAYSIMLYEGTDGNTILNTLGDFTRNDSCLVQAVLTAGAQVMTAASTLTLVIRLWILLRSAIYVENKVENKDRWIIIGLVLLPHLFFLVFSLAAVFIGQQNLIANGDVVQGIQRAIPVNFYCTVSGPPAFIKSVYGTTLGLLLITMGFDRTLYKRWAAFRSIPAKGTLSLPLLIRMIAFSLYRVVVAVAYASVLKATPEANLSGMGATLGVKVGFPVWVDMLQAAIPLTATIILGMRSDMLGAISWGCRRSLGQMMSLRAVSKLSGGDNDDKDEKQLHDHDHQLTKSQV